MPNFDLTGAAAGGGGSNVSIDGNGFIRIAGAPEGYVAFKDVIEPIAGGGTRLMHIVRDDAANVDRLMVDITIP